MHAREFVPSDQEQAAGQASKEPAVIEAPAAGQSTSESAGQATLKSKRAAQFTIAKTLVDLFEKKKMLT